MRQETKIGPVVDLDNPCRDRISILKEMLDRGEISRQQYDMEARIAGLAAGAMLLARQSSGA